MRPLLFAAAGVALTLLVSRESAAQTAPAPSSDDDLEVPAPASSTPKTPAAPVATAPSPAQPVGGDPSKPPPAVPQGETTPAPSSPADAARENRGAARAHRSARGTRSGRACAPDRQERLESRLAGASPPQPADDVVRREPVVASLAARARSERVRPGAVPAEPGLARPARRRTALRSTRTGFSSAARAFVSSAAGSTPRRPSRSTATT